MPRPDNDVLIREFQVGLDRSAIDQHGQIQLPREEQSSKRGVVDESTNKNAGHGRARSQAHHMVDSIRLKNHQAANNIRKVLHMEKASANIEPKETTILALDADEESNSRLMYQLPASEKRTIKDMVHNPVETVKSKISSQGNHEVAANIAAKEIPHSEEVDMVNAYTAMNSAETETEKLLAIEHLSELMRQRQSTFVRWTLDRHVTKVRTMLQDHVVKPLRADYEKDDAEQGIMINWKGYIEQVCSGISRYKALLTYRSYHSTMLRCMEASILGMVPIHHHLRRKQSCQISSAF